jgi:hypothetical protein
MAASGVPPSNKSSPDHIQLAQFALAAQHALSLMRVLKEDYGNGANVPSQVLAKVGLHRGALVAGVRAHNLF